MHISFCHKNQKNVSQKEVKNLTFEVSLYFYIKQVNQNKINSLVVKLLDSQSRGPVFETIGWLQGRLSLSTLGR